MATVTPVSSLTARAGALVLGGVLATGLLAGCGSDDEGGDPDASTSAAATTATTDDATTEPTQGYLPVPAGVTLTEPGANLRYGATATIAWRPRQDRVVVLDLVVDRIDETTFKESFEGWVVTPQMKGQTPYFVHAKATNVSRADAGGLLVPLYALSGAASLYEPLSFTEEEFEPCPGGVLPEKLRPGKSADLCFVYLLPEGQPLTAAAFDPVGELAPVTWRGKITKVDDGKSRDDKRKKSDRDKTDG